VGIHSTVSPTSDASTHYVREPVLRTSQDQLPAYQAIWMKMYERGGVEPPMPRTNSWIEPRGATSFANKRKPMGSKF